MDRHVISASIRSPVQVIHLVLEEYGMGFDVALDIEKRLHTTLKSVETDKSQTIIHAGNATLQWGTVDR